MDRSDDCVPVVHHHAICEAERAIAEDRQLGVAPAILFMGVRGVVERTSIPLHHQPIVDQLVDASDARDLDLMSTDDPSAFEPDATDALEETLASRLQPRESAPARVREFVQPRAERPSAVGFSVQDGVQDRAGDVRVLAGDDLTNGRLTAHHEERRDRTAPRDHRLIVVPVQDRVVPILRGRMAPAVARISEAPRVRRDSNVYAPVFRCGPAEPGGRRDARESPADPNGLDDLRGCTGVRVPASFHPDQLGHLDRESERPFGMAASPKLMDRGDTVRRA
nr:hypothetical protein [Plantibacter sp. VKM Ac-2876]